MVAADYTNMKLIQKLLILSLVVVLVIMSGCSTTSTREIPELIEPVGMEPDIAIAEYGEIFNVTSVEGIVLPFIHELCFEANGIVDEVYVTVGSEVKAGDIIARLDSDIYEQSLSAAVDNLDYSTEAWNLTKKKAELQIEIAELELDDLIREGGTSSQIELKRIEIAELENKLAADKALWELTRSELEQSIEELKLQVECSILAAPCDGTIVDSKAIEGTYAVADTELFRLAEDTNLHISTGYVTAEQIEDALEIYGTVAGKAVSVEYVPMDRVEYISRNDSGKDMNSTFIVSDSGNADVESGMSAVIFLVTERENNALIVPSCAVRRDVNGYFVYIVDETGTQIRRNIKRGINNDAYVQVVEGLEEGDVVYAGN